MVGIHPYPITVIRVYLWMREPFMGLKPTFKVLEDFEGEEAVEAAFAALAEARPEIQRGAIAVFAAHSHRPGIAYALEQFDRLSLEARVRLGEESPQVTTILREFLLQPDEAVRLRAVSLIHRLNRPELCALLATSINDSSKAVRRFARIPSSTVSSGVSCGR